jgi:hypothetical protein
MVWTIVVYEHTNDEKYNAVELYNSSAVHNGHFLKAEILGGLPNYDLRRQSQLLRNKINSSYRPPYNFAYALYQKESEEMKALCLTKVKYEGNIMITMVKILVSDGSGGGFGSIIMQLLISNTRAANGRLCLLAMSHYYLIMLYLKHGLVFNAPGKLCDEGCQSSGDLVHLEFTADSELLLSGREFNLVAILRDLFNLIFINNDIALLLEQLTQNKVIILKKEMVQLLYFTRLELSRRGLTVKFHRQILILLGGKLQKKYMHDLEVGNEAKIRHTYIKQDTIIEIYFLHVHVDVNAFAELIAVKNEFPDVTHPNKSTRRTINLTDDPDSPMRYNTSDHSNSDGAHTICYLCADMEDVAKRIIFANVRMNE